MERKWWHDKIVYQIYPKSFCDTNGDGIGDLRGIIEKLDYLKSLGVDILWLSPIYQSPLADEGYDISDYYAIDPRFGSLKDVDELIDEAGKRDMSVLMDLVANHCSDEHAWFKQACEDPEGPYGSFFYIRKKKPDGTPPTNWRSYFGTPAWDELPGHPELMYLHVFHKKQPDLNWENPRVREEIYRNINWWLDRGLGGFRIDAIMNIKKPAVFRDYPADRSDGSASVGNIIPDARGIGDFLQEMKEETFLKHDSFTVGEVCGENESELADFIGEDGYFSSMFDFTADLFGKSAKGWYDRTPCLPEDFKQCVILAQGQIGRIGFLSNILENHDQARGVSRYIPREELSDTSKKALACAYFLLRGLPFIYQGQEIGMENKVFRSYEEIADISSKAEYRISREAGLSEEETFEVISRYSRDNGRTPMQWTGGKNAGFSEGEPWLAVNDNYPGINVEGNLADPDSVWHFYQKLIRLRKDPAYRDTLVYGDFQPWLPEEKNLLAYIRRGVKKGELSDLQADTPDVYVFVNMQAEPRTIPLPKQGIKPLLNNLQQVRIEGGLLTLEPWQALVLA